MFSYNISEDWLSRGFRRKTGNGKIDRYPPLEWVKVKNILVLWGELFEEIKKEAADFKEWLLKLGLNEKKKVSSRASSQRDPGSRRKKINSGSPACASLPAGQVGRDDKRRPSNYKPSNIWNMQYGKVLRWQRVKEWTKYITDPMDKYNGSPQNL